MPDLQGYSVTASGNLVGGIREHVISGRVCDSQSGALLADFSGANAIHFPQAVATLTAAQHRALVDLIARFLIQASVGF